MKTTVLFSAITIVSVTDSPPATTRRRLGVVPDKSVDITVTLDLTLIHGDDVADDDANQEEKKTDRTPLVVGVVVLILVLAVLLVVGVIITYKILDNKKKRQS